VRGREAVLQIREPAGEGLARGGQATHQRFYLFSKRFAPREEYRIPNFQNAIPND